MIAALTQRMITYNGADPHLTNHAIKVAAYSAFIADREDCDRSIVTLVTLAAILHDIGIPNAKRVHGMRGASTRRSRGRRSHASSWRVWVSRKTWQSGSASSSATTTPTAPSTV